MRCATLRWVLLAGLTVTLLLTTTGQGQASTELRKALKDVAANIKQLLDGKGEDSIAVGQFTGPANFPTSSGPGIAQLLSEELQKLSIAVKKRAKLGIKGEYLVTEVPAEEPKDIEESKRPKVLAILLKGTVEDEFGKVVTDFSFKQTVKGEATFVDLIGTPVDLPPGEDLTGRDRKLRESLSKPKTHINKTRISAREDGKLALEVLVKGQPREAKDDEGLAFVKIERGEIYAIRLINDTDQHMAVRLAIDGLSMFQFSELRHKEGPKKGEPLYSVVFVAPHKDVVIKGWHRTNEKSDSFLVTEYAKTAAASIQQTANLGTITASFHASWEGNTPPADEPPKTKSTTTGDGTGFGPSVEAKFTVVKRNIGVIRAAVSVRYTK